MIVKKDPFDSEGLRSFVDPNDAEVIYYIVPPGASDLRSADYEYSKVYTRCLVEGITTASEMTDILMRRGIIGSEFEQRAGELSEILREKIKALETAKDMMDKQVLAVEVAEARDELFRWNQRLNAPLSNTCEHLADDSRLEYITSRVIRKEDGSYVWETFNDYLDEKSQGLAQKARFEVMLYLQGLDSDFLDKTPEAVALKEVGADIAKALVKAEEDAATEAEAEAAATEEILSKEEPVVEKEIEASVVDKKPSKRKTSKSDTKTKN